MSRHKAIVLGLILAVLSGPAVGDEAIPNWSAPATWSPSKSHGATALSETNPLPFIALSPCRIVDTRGNGAPIQGGMFTGGSDVRNYALPGICGLPPSIAAVSVNFTVVGPTDSGFLVSWPTGGAVPPVSILNFNAGQTVANAAVVPTSTAGSITVNVSAPTHLLVDVNGYYSKTTFTNRLASGEFFGIFGTRSGDGVIFGENNSSALGSAGVRGLSLGIGRTYGVTGFTSSTEPGAAGVYGQDGTGAPYSPVSYFISTGIQGQSAGGVGVVGVSRNIGVGGFTLDSSGALLAEGYLGTGSGIGVFGYSNSTSDVGGNGVFGWSNNTGSGHYGVLGQSRALTDSAGVLGDDGSSSGATGRSSAGVRGESGVSFGVLGLSQYIGVVGSLYNSAANLVAEGFLGSNFGVSLDINFAPWGVFSSGNFGATGAKHFVEPHVSDPTKVILYSSLEGREVGTYFRGTGHTVNGRAVIEVPEDFRIVTDEEGLTVQLTPVGPLTTMSVESRDLSRIVVLSSKDVRFDYLVQGVRRAFKDFEPIASGTEFAPRSPEDRMPGYLTEEAKRRLVANGTYNPDGSVNMQTAERVGWTRVWKEREERDKAAADAVVSAIDPGTAEHKRRGTR